MFKMEMKFNGKKITSSRQLAKELSKSVDAHIEKEVRKVAGVGTKVRKTRSGFTVKGTKQQIDRVKHRLR